MPLFVEEPTPSYLNDVSLQHIRAQLATLFGLYVGRPKKEQKLNILLV